jgi:hypothetical protein
MGTRGPGAGRKSAGLYEPVEGLGYERTSFLLFGPNAFYSGLPDPYKTDAEAKRDWRKFRPQLMAACTDWTRRPWAFWVFEQGMDDAPSGGDQGAIILERGLCRNKTERKFLELWEAGEGIKAMELLRANETAAT